MDLWTGIRRSQYSILSDKDLDKDSISSSRCGSLFTEPLKLSRSTLITVLILLASIISGISGYLIGRHWVIRGNNSLIQLSNVPITFEREFDFAEAPSNFTNQRWNSLFPLNDGFFEHLDVGPDPVTFAVFHQLHCLDGIRHAYWLIRNGNHSEGGNSSHAENSANARVQHCLEYLRQSLMCTADTTVEPVGRGSKGKAIVQGFGTQHLCKDFHQLIEWTSQWENPFEKIE